MHSRLHPNVFRGESAAATPGSRTTSRILARTNSAAVVPAALERIERCELGQVGGGQTAGRHDAITRRELGTIAGPHAPASRRLVEARRRHPRVELNVAAQIEFFRDVVGVPQDLRLGGVALRPFPLLLQLLGELIGIFHALDVAARARIAIPEPGAADAAAGLANPYG